MKQTYFLHGAGEIRHMLLMAWGGEPLTGAQVRDMKSVIQHSNAAIRELGIQHGDLRAENMLWNSELKRVLLIDFHRSSLIDKRMLPLKRKRRMNEAADGKRLCRTMT